MSLRLADLRNVVELHCIRHGATRYNEENRFNGWNDLGITERQARELRACEFSSSGFDAIYCSPLKRCIQTAEALRVGDWIQDERIKERNLGIFEGRSFEECKTAFPEETSRFLRFDADYVVPDGESRQANLDRVQSWLRDILHHDRVLAFTHGGVVDLMYRLAAGIPLHGGDTIYGGANARRSVFRYDEGRWSILQFDQPLAG